MQNPIIWHDLMTPDAKAAQKFYGQVLGWNFDAQMPEYTIAQVGDAGVGGIMPTPERAKGMHPFWGGYIYASDVDAICAKAVKLGGAIHRPAWDVPGVGRMAFIADPDGARFYVMQPLPQGEQKLPEEGSAGTVGWNELHAADLDKAWTFYSNLFGWTKGAAHDMGEDVGIYQVFQINGKDAGGMIRKMTPQPMWVYYFNVDDIYAAAARVKKAGGTLFREPMQVPGGSWIQAAMDPQGAAFSLISTRQ